MRYRVIDNKRLNVYLTKQDLQKENVNIEDIVKGSPETVVKIKKIFSAVSYAAHFNEEKNGLNIVFMPIVDGDLLISASVDESIMSKKTTIFKFDDFDNMISATESVNCFQGIDSDLYGYKNEYWMVLTARGCIKTVYKSIISVFSEFGEFSDINIVYIKEHGKTLIKRNALEVIKECFF